MVVAALVAVAVAAPQFGNQYGNQFDRRDRVNYRPIAILRDDRQDFGDGNFNYQFETENGINVNARGTPGSKGQSNIEGYYRCVFFYDFVFRLCDFFFSPLSVTGLFF